jgi:hypothetical protein
MPAASRRPHHWWFNQGMTRFSQARLYDILALSLDISLTGSGSADYNITAIDYHHLLCHIAPGLPNAPHRRRPALHGIYGMPTNTSMIPRNAQAMNFAFVALSSPRS